MVPADDDREYLLYLAWFGPNLVKVGLTAAERNRDRLLEQGAFAFVVLAAGPYTAIRQAEKSIAATGLVAERVTAKAKAAAWPHLRSEAERVAALSAVRNRLAGRVLWPQQIAFRSGGPVDQAEVFGLDEALSEPWREVTEISDSAILSGDIRAVIGRQLILNTSEGLLLCDMRRAAGWTLHPLLAHCAPSGLTLAAGPDLGGHEQDQPALF